MCQLLKGTVSSLKGGYETTKREGYKGTKRGARKLLKGKGTKEQTNKKGTKY